MSFNKVLKPEEETIIRRTVAELDDGMVVNLGIGLPTFVPGFLPPEKDVMFHAENGFVGMGAPVQGGTPDHPVIDSGGRACTLVQGAACFDSLLSFTLVRSGRLDAVILGAFEVAVNGDLANWIIPGKLTPGMGGAMELAQKARHVIVVSRHANRKGENKLVETCSLPLTAAGCVDVLITEKALFRKINDKITLCSVAPGLSVADALVGMESYVPVAPTLEHWPQNS